MTAKKGTFIVTGANGGLGRAIASQFLSSPESASHKGLWAVRNPASAPAIQETNQNSPNGSEHEIVQVDLSTLDSVRSAAKSINSRVASGELPPIRALVLNAALQFVRGQNYTNDGIESSIAVNYLSNFLLAVLLLQSMDKEMGRIVIIASWTHDPSHPLNAHVVTEEHKTILQDGLNSLVKPAKDKEGDEYNSGMRRYGASKTLIVTIMYELQRRISNTKDYSNISVLAVDPGGMPDTSLLRDSSAGLRFFIGWIVSPLTPMLTWIFPNGYFRTRQKSAKDVFNASFDETTWGKHPKTLYLNGSAKSQSNAETNDEEKQKRLWKQSVEITGLKKEETVLSLD